MNSTSYTLYVRCGDERLGAVPVCVTRKRVRNLNLRVRGDGSVVASVPWRTSRARVQEFLDAHVGWIAERVSRKAERQAESREAAPSPAYALWGCEHRTADGHTPTAAELDELWRREVERMLPGVIARMEPLVGGACELVAAEDHEQQVGLVHARPRLDPHQREACRLPARVP